MSGCVGLDQEGGIGMDLEARVEGPLGMDVFAEGFETW